jgi:hypothetical protein
VESNAVERSDGSGVDCRLWRREPRCGATVPSPPSLEPGRRRSGLSPAPGAAQTTGQRRCSVVEPSVIVLGKTAAELSIQEEWLKLSRIKSHAVPLSYPSRTAGLQKRSRVMESQSALALRAM